MKNYNVNLSYPNQSLIHYPLVLELFKKGGKATPNEVYDLLADYFNLNDELRSKTVNDNTKELKWHNNVRWARQQLVDKGILRNDSERGVWELTSNALYEYIESETEHALSEDTTETEFSQSKLDSLLNIQKEIGDIGECIVFEYEIKFLTSKGLHPLAEKVRRVSQENCRQGYDIISYFEDGREKYIEVKSSTSKQLEFYISINELNKAKKLGKEYCVYLVRGVDIKLKTFVEIKQIYHFTQLIEDNMFNLVPIKWRVSFGENYSI